MANKEVDQLRAAAELAREAREAIKKAAAKPVTKARPISAEDNVAAGHEIGILTERTNSRGFRMCKAMAVQVGLLDRTEAPEEMEACRQFTKALDDAGQLPANVGPNSILMPFGSELLTDDVVGHKGFKVFKSMWAAGAENPDLDEVNWLRRKVYKTPMSYLSDSIGGTLVAPPVQGELIELVRPNEALQQAGVTRVPLPPNGRIVYPRQTGPSTMYWVGENISITESNPTTGQIAMMGKKGGVYVTVPNELLKFSSVAADTLIRNDAAKTLALGLDEAGLYGSGSASRPKGLSLYTGSNEVIQYASVSPAPKGIGGNGNTLRPEDGYRMIGLIEDRNFQFTGWIFRPSMANNINGYRADAAAPADAAGGFVQSFMRAFSDRMPADNWCGYKMSKSATIRNNRTKGSGTGLTEVFGGQWEHLLHGMFGAIEFAASNQAGNNFQQDQTSIRALVITDFVPRYEGAFVHYDQLVNSVN
jgi:hypothetical protein